MPSAEPCYWPHDDHRLQEQFDTAIEITSRYPRVHGTPVHFGNPKMVGIDDIMQPYSGVSPVMHENEEPVFWACGVTPQVIVEHAKPPICITHKPGHMLITDRLNTELAD